MDTTNPITPVKTGTATVAVPPSAIIRSAADKASEPPKPPNTSKAFFNAKIGALEFNSASGAILRGSHVWLSTDRFSTARILLDDPDGTILGQIASQSDVEVELGFIGGEKRKKFVGKILRYGRRSPYCTVVIAADPSAALQNQVGSATVFADNRPPEAQDQTLQAIATEDVTVASSPGLVDAMRQLDNATATASGGQQAVTAAEQFTLLNQDLRFASGTRFSTSQQGTSSVQQSRMQAATSQAALQGDVVVTRGDTVHQVQPGRGESSGLVLDYKGNRAAFIGKPTVLKKTPLQLMSGYGQIVVAGYSVNDKANVGATVVVPGTDPPHPTGVIQIPDWQEIQLSSPIYPGSSFTWADATKNGTRVPTRQIMERIVAVAQAIQPLVERTMGPGRKWQINSWYRDPASNRRVGGATRSRHLNGDAVDAEGFNFEALHSELSGSWNGGLARKRGSFIHIDIGPRRRWEY